MMRCERPRRFVMGPIVIAIILLAGDGLYGRLSSARRRLRRP